MQPLFDLPAEHLQRTTHFIAVNRASTFAELSVTAERADARAETTAVDYGSSFSFSL